MSDVAGNRCDLPSRISRLSPSDQRLVARLVETLEARAAAPSETPGDRLRRRIEAVRSRQA